MKPKPKKRRIRKRKPRRLMIRTGGSPNGYITAIVLRNTRPPIFISCYTSGVSLKEAQRLVAWLNRAIQFLEQEERKK